MMMISEKMAAALNEQVKNEFYAWWTYQQMAFVSDTMGLKIYSQWFDVQAAEEQTHAMKIAKYLLDQGAEVKLLAMPEAKHDYKDIVEVVQGAVDHELMVTRQIHELVKLAQSESDFATGNFLQWYVDEQVEEVATVSELLDLTKMGKDSGHMLMVENRIMALRSGGGEKT
ncbi:MAG: ferritin [candidate division Zixibacteria bacterium]|nr:ferritin [candidate division Zixibacteria bacterium]